jgi:hypothetical protein
MRRCGQPDPTKMKFLEVWGLWNSRYNTAQRVMAFDWRNSNGSLAALVLRISNMI